MKASKFSEAQMAFVLKQAEDGTAGNKTPKRRVKAKLREDRSEATHSNQVWAMDFVHNQLATGRKLRILTIVDTHS